VRRLIEAAHDEAWHALNDNRDVLDRLVLELLERETLNAKEIAEVFRDVRKRPVRPTWLSSEHRLLSDKPPVLTPAEQAALNGSGAPAGAVPVAGDRATEAAIDRAAQVGASPYAQDGPTTQVIETPEDAPVNPDGHL